MKKIHLEESSYIEKTGKILAVSRLTRLEKYFKIALEGGESLGHDPGQFVMVSIAGVGDVPISISSSPTKETYFELVVRDVGKVTGAMHKLEAGDKLGIRGPFGKGFPLRVLEGNDLLIIAGGLGIVPLRSLINFVIDNRRSFGKIDILLGCKTPDEMIFSDEMKRWNERLDVNFSFTVDHAEPGWKGNVGLITSLIPNITVDPYKTFAAIVGPPIMYKFVIFKLLEKGVPENQIMVSLERHMKCGVGKCGHCQIGGIYCCRDGPVFSLDKIKYGIETL